MSRITLLAVLVCSSTASAAPISSCLLNDPFDPQQGVTCNLYESLADGTPSEISNVVPLPLLVVAGFIGILEHPGGSQTDPTQWSDVLAFLDRGDGLAQSIQLFSIGCNLGAGNTSCFPSPGQIGGFIVESPIDPTVFTAPAIVGTNTFNIYSNSVPEPASLLLMVFGLLAYAILWWRKAMLCG